MSASASGGASASEPDGDGEYPERQRRVRGGAAPRQLVGLVGLVALAAAGCGGGGGGDLTKVIVSPTRESLSAAADRTLEGGDYRMEFTQTFGSGGGGFTADGTGEWDSDNQRVRMTMDMDLPDAGPQTAEIIFDSGTMFMKMSMLGDRWVKLDLDALAPGISDLIGAGGGTQDPSQFLAFLKGADDVRDLGKEDIRGVSTTHFLGSYTMGDALDQMTAEQREALDSLIDKLPDGVLDSEVPFDAWVDDEGRVRQMEITMDMSGIGGKASSLDTVDMHMEMFDFGEDVTVEVPDDAIDMSQLMDSFSS